MHTIALAAFSFQFVLFIDLMSVYLFILPFTHLLCLFILFLFLSVIVIQH